MRTLGLALGIVAILLVAPANAQDIFRTITTITTITHNASNTFNSINAASRVLGATGNVLGATSNLLNSNGGEQEQPQGETSCQTTARIISAAINELSTSFPDDHVAYCAFMRNQWLPHVEQLIRLYNAQTTSCGDSWVYEGINSWRSQLTATRQYIATNCGAGHYKTFVVKNAAPTRLSNPGAQMTATAAKARTVPTPTVRVASTAASIPLAKTVSPLVTHMSQAVLPAVAPNALAVSSPSRMHLAEATLPPSPQAMHVVTASPAGQSQLSPATLPILARTVETPKSEDQAPVQGGKLTEVATTTGEAVPKAAIGAKGTDKAQPADVTSNGAAPPPAPSPSPTVSLTIHQMTTAPTVASNEGSSQNIPSPCQDRIGSTGCQNSDGFVVTTAPAKSQPSTESPKVPTASTPPNATEKTAAELAALNAELQLIANKPDPNATYPSSSTATPTAMDTSAPTADPSPTPSPAPSQVVVAGPGPTPVSGDSSGQSPPASSDSRCLVIGDVTVVSLGLCTTKGGNPNGHTHTGHVHVLSPGDPGYDAKFYCPESLEITYYDGDVGAWVKNVGVFRNGKANQPLDVCNQDPTDIHIVEP